MKLLGDDFNNENRSKFFKKNKINKRKVISAGMIHGNKAVIVTSKSPQIIPGADALVSKDDLFLAITIADCVPVYFYDEKNKVIGLAHAGWRGIIGDIAGNTLREMLKLGAKTEKIKVVLGPGIRKCHFEIKEDILDNFKKYPQAIILKEDKIFADLFGIIKKQLLNFEIKEENIFESGECTFENKEKFFSYRRDKPEVVEVMMAVIGIR
ncbi:MAG: hypothetical protein UR66_C0003G0030 [Candidatus Moranbacteria bacterium GW2011_GWE1_35_17]|nr:MAG: hypothetical protein UR66_C0003G0030 [Candidatus Moranbacteria bacterium GW2011_GWE1_35_17]KKP81436.1 MAG: hypothetical protein UR82_C0063G0005 [Candidatus Moranbacteria bacterium GW2011_GWF1_35_5]